MTQIKILTQKPLNKDKSGLNLPVLRKSTDLRPKKDKSGKHSEKRCLLSEKNKNADPVRQSNTAQGEKNCLKTNLLPQRAKKSVFEMIFGIQNLIRKEKMAILGSKKRSVVV